MDVIKTYFKQDSKCNECQSTFSISKKRRKCKLCSNCYTEKIFCKNCSKAVRHKYFWVLKSKRYCNHCYEALPTESKSEFSEDLPNYKEFSKILKSKVQIIKHDPLKDYSFIKKIGEGAVGSVYKAQNNTSGTEVALKKIELSKCFEKNKAINEIGIMQLTVHENIIECIAAYQYNK
jgi:Protein kinase domain